MTLRQPIAAYVESVHSRNGFSRDRMAPEAATAFDREMAAVVAPYAEDGEVVLQIRGQIQWGLPGAEGE